MNKEALKTVKKVHELFKKKKLTLSVAESCTGGLISHYLTTLPGASKFFKGGITAYSATVKKDILHVSPAILRKYGIVSAETAIEMARKVRMFAKTDYAIATTGNLGPDVLEGIPTENGVHLVLVDQCHQRATCVCMFDYVGSNLLNESCFTANIVPYTLEASTGGCSNPDTGFAQVL